MAAGPAMATGALTVKVFVMAVLIKDDAIRRRGVTALTTIATVIIGASKPDIFTPETTEYAEGFHPQRTFGHDSTSIFRWGTWRASTVSTPWMADLIFRTVIVQAVVVQTVIGQTEKRSRHPSYPRSLCPLFQ